MGVQGRTLLKDWTPEKLIEIIDDCGGNIKAIARRIGCYPHQVYRAMEDDPTIYDAVEAARKVNDIVLLDAHEDTINCLSDRWLDDPERALRAAKYYLEAHGTSRGWGIEKGKDGECPAAKAAAAEAAAKGQGV
ncbi:MAG: hypothetical protein Q8O94_01845 [bacterium]|nr:hypothetical protein [bacterium]